MMQASSPGVDAVGVDSQGVEKPIVSKMLVEGSNRRAYAVDRHAGVVSAGPVVRRDC